MVKKEILGIDEVAVPERWVFAGVFSLCAVAWGIFISSAFKFSAERWFPILLFSRVAMCVAALVLPIVFFRRPSWIILSRYFIVCLLAQGIFGVLEPHSSLEFYQYVVYFFFLSSWSYSGSFRTWILQYFPISFLGLALPLFVKDASLFGSLSSVAYNFTTTIAMSILSVIAVASNSRKYHVLKENLRLKDQILDHERSRKSEVEQELAKVREQIETDTRAKAIAKIAEQVYHDLDSPLKALDAIITLAPEISPETRKFLVSSVTRINEIVSDLALRGKSGLIDSEVKLASTNLRLANLNTVIDSVIVEKQTLLARYRPEVTLVFVPQAQKNFNGVVSLAPFKRVISNLINNAIDAIEGSGKVSVNVQRVDGDTLIRISDTGKGIPKDLIPQLMQRGVTYGKKGGSGLGLYYSKCVIETWQGKLDLESCLGVGTIVTVTVPSPRKVSSITIPAPARGPTAKEMA